MPRIRQAVKIYANFDEGEVSKIDFTSLFNEYEEGGLMRLDILQDAAYQMMDLYNAELAKFPGKTMLALKKG
tara:strand:+ start:2094 stop:2309 length:216 start_codon:yes stop_codon:yes gene_type:complete